MLQGCLAERPTDNPAVRLYRRLGFAVVEIEFAVTVTGARVCAVITIDGFGDGAILAAVEGTREQ